MSRVVRHPDWCARGHRCGLGEHRARPITLTIPGAGSLVLTRVRAVDGSDHAEIRMSVVLPAEGRGARHRLAALLSHLTALLGPARQARPVPSRPAVPAGLSVPASPAVPAGRTLGRAA